MPDRVKIRGVWHDAKSAPAWFEHILPGGLHLAATMKTARENHVRNLSGSDLGNAILWIIAGLFVVTLIWFITTL